MALNHDYEPICNSILHRGSFPTLEGAMYELLSEEVRLNILKPSTTIDSNNILAVPYKTLHIDKIQGFEYAYKLVSYFTHCQLILGRNFI